MAIVISMIPPIDPTIIPAISPAFNLESSSSLPIIE